MIDQQMIGIVLLLIEAIAITQVKKKYVVGLTIVTMLTVVYFFILGALK